MVKYIITQRCRTGRRVDSRCNSRSQAQTMNDKESILCELLIVYLIIHMKFLNNQISIRKEIKIPYFGDPENSQTGARSKKSTNSKKTIFYNVWPGGRGWVANADPSLYAWRVPAAGAPPAREPRRRPGWHRVAWSGLACPTWL